MPRLRCIAANAYRRDACSTRGAPRTGHPPTWRRSRSCSCSGSRCRPPMRSTRCRRSGWTARSSSGCSAGRRRRARPPRHPCGPCSTCGRTRSSTPGARAAGGSLSDLGELALGHALGEQHVLGVGGASMTLSGLMLPTPARTVLDLGTGCGIQAMHASPVRASASSRPTSRERALRLARLNAELNGIDGRRVPAREPLRARRGGALRPDRLEPAVRDHAARRPGCPSTSTATAAWWATRSSRP